MKRQYLIFAPLTLLLALFLSGCSSYLGTGYTAVFSPPVKQETSVILKENDFQYVQRDLRGSYTYFLLGIPGIAEIPLGDPRLFSNALADMYMGIQSQTEGRACQLVNWKYDARSVWYFLPIGTKTAVFRADMIEYKQPY